MLKIEMFKQFKKDYKLAVKRGCDPQKLSDVISILANEQPLSLKYKDHPLTNSKHYQNVRECHIEPDWLLIYKIVEQTLVLELPKTGTHSDLF